MALNSSGKISLAGSTVGESIAVELGLGATSQIALNDTSVRTLLAKPSGEIALSDAYGKANQFSATISSTQLELNLRTWALSNGWNGSTKAVITIGSGVYIYSNNTATPALTISGSWPNGIELINNGFIMGKGGDSGGFAGGPAISLGISVTIDNTNSSAYVGGGGGGGGNSPHGGGGAGGGGGNPTVGTSGNNGVTNTGGGGGRIFAGTGGAGTSYAAKANQVGSGGGSGGGGGKFYTSSYTHRSSLFACSYNFSESGSAGGGGGGWGAAGGTGHSGDYRVGGGSGGSANAVGNNAATVGATTAWGGGAGGKAVALNGYSVTWVSGDTARIYGAVS